MESWVDIGFCVLNFFFHFQVSTERIRDTPVVVTRRKGEERSHKNHDKRHNFSLNYYKRKVEFAPLAITFTPSLHLPNQRAEWYACVDSKMTKAIMAWLNLHITIWTIGKWSFRLTRAWSLTVTFIGHRE